MNVRLIKTWQWQSGLVYNDTFYINTYCVRTHMQTTSMHDHDHDVAYGRMAHWFQEVMQDSVMLSADSAVARAYAATGQRLLLFPDQPVDQLVGIMLCVKLNSITEGRLIITDVDLSSVHGADMLYQHNHAECQGALSAAGWWRDVRPTWHDAAVPARSAKVVKLRGVADWNSLDLDWQCNKRSTDSAIVFGDFDRDVDK